MKRASLALLSMTLLLGNLALAGEEVLVDGVPHIKNGSTPSQGTETLELKELWRAGGEDDEVFFGMIIQVLVDGEENVYLLDAQLNEVQVYSPGGENINTLSREGDGPGEIRGPADMMFLPDGTLGILQSFPGKVVKVDLEGNPAGIIQAGTTEATAGGVIVFTNAISSGEHMLITGVRISPNDLGQNRTHFIATYDLEGNEVTRYFERLQEWDFSNFELTEIGQYFPHGRYTALDNEGRVYTVPHRNSYQIQVYQPDGTLERVIEREYDHWQRDEQEISLINAAMEAAEAQFPFEIKTSVETIEPDISRLHLAADGSLWVLSSRGAREQPDNIIVTFDVFDPAGHFIKQVAVAGQGDGRRDFLMFAGPNRMIQVVGFLDAAASAQGVGAALDEEEAAPMEVIYFEY